MKTDTTCTICETVYAVEPPFCLKCEYPFSALEKDKSVFVGRLFSKKLKIKEAKDKIKRAQNILWVIGGINVLSYAVVVSQSLVVDLNILDLFIGLFFIVFGFYASKNPFLAILISLILLISLYALNAWVDPVSIFRGIIFKIVFIVGLVYALKSIYEVQKIKNENDYFKEMEW